MSEIGSQKYGKCRIFATWRRSVYKFDTLMRIRIMVWILHHMTYQYVIQRRKLEEKKTCLGFYILFLFNSVVASHWYQCGSGYSTLGQCGSGSSSGSRSGVLMIKKCQILQASMRDVQATGETFSPQKKTSSNSNHEISSLYSIFVDHFCPPGSVSPLNADPGPAGQFNADPCWSGYIRIHNTGVKLRIHCFDSR